MARKARTRPAGGAPAATATPRAAAPLTASRRRLFWAVTLLLPVLFFALLEGGLRLGGYGDPLPLFVPVDAAGTVKMPNREVARRYFAREAGIPNPNPDFFSAEKPASSFRLFVQGESSAAGFPYYRGASFPQVLAARLRAAYPGRTVEVVNTGMAAIASFTLLDLADEIIAEQPDAVLVYTGHNEWYGALGAASTQTLGRSGGLVRLYLRLRDWRTVQLLRDAIAAVRPRRAPPGGTSAGNAAGGGGTTLMQRMVGEEAVPLGGESYRAGLAQFEENMDLLLARYARAGVPVFVGTLASNERDQRPFVSVTAGGAPDPYDPVPDLRCIDAADSTGDAATLVGAFEQAAKADTASAFRAFVLGRARLAAGDSSGARDALRRARDLDALRFRAPTDANAVLRRVAARHGATVVESEARLETVAPAGSIGYETMLEHLHPTLDGYALIADAFFDALTGAGLPAPNPRPTPPGRRFTLITAADSFGAVLRVDRLTRAWPFRPDEVIEAVPDSVRTPPPVVQMATQMLDGADWYATTRRLADWYVTQGRWADALRTRTALTTAYFFLAEPFADRGNTRVEAASVGRPFPDHPAAAIADYERALALDPGYLAAHTMLGALALQTGDAAAAVPHLERVAAGANAPPQALYNLAGAYAQLGRWDDAARTADRLAQANPQYRPFAAAVRNRTLGI